MSDRAKDDCRFLSRLGFRLHAPFSEDDCALSFVPRASARGRFPVRSPRSSAAHALHVWLPDPPVSLYPFGECPLVAYENSGLPAWVCLQVTLRLHAEAARIFSGAPMCFELYEWLTQVADGA